MRLRWIFDQPVLVQYALVALPAGIGGVLVWSVFGRRARLLRRAERAAGRARAGAQAVVRRCISGSALAYSGQGAPEPRIL